MFVRCSPSQLFLREEGFVRNRTSRLSSISKPSAGEKCLTQQIFDQIQKEEEAGGAGGQMSYTSLQRADEAWSKLKNNQVVHKALLPMNDPLDFVEYDVVVCGGTLGIFLAYSLQKRGFRVVIIEKGPLRGRKQEWNISRNELNELQKEGLFTEEEIESCINIEWEKVRAGFHNGVEIWTTGVLNLGISPERLIKLCQQKFVDAGGTLYEQSTLQGIELHINGVQISLNITDHEISESKKLTGRLLIDCMGHFSPIVRQIRGGQRPDGVCLVVGTLSRGLMQNDFSDLIKTTEPILKNSMNGNRLQYFWEAFPAGSGEQDRTTYMFSYVDASPNRPSLQEMFEDYWKMMPKYQNVNFKDLEFRRALFGFFPTYKDSPLNPAFDRIIHVGDAGGLQSPLSFGGFGAMLRHLTRHTNAISTALNAKIVDKKSLSLINPYNPGLSATWLFQKAMCAQENTPQDFINETLSDNFRGMNRLGPDVLTPFLQDVTSFTPLTLTLLFQIVMNPLFLVEATRLLGLATIFEWIPHYLRLGIYQFGSIFAPFMRQAANALPPRDRYKLQCYADALEYGSGADYVKH